MPVVRSADAEVHDLHDVRFVSYACTATGSTELCAWRLEVPAGTAGPGHTISREEVFLVLSGTPRLTIDGEAHDLSPGDVAMVPAGSLLAMGNPGNGPASVWVTTGIGLEAVFPDGSRISPPWAR
ncbi:cupin domain-containing protein [Actinacidiphila sp. bgisy167]|uniref:cupin domain-containing protein n=1 Tax=Actinacidiphila sp. bgisy167 TaxID=3413797 RepID=UPI003D755CC3